MTKKAKETKTNVMRLLDQADITYVSNFYTVDDGALDGISVARKIGQNPEEVFKTLVCQGHSGNFYVFVIPVAESLDLKKAAKACGEKSIEMIPQKLLLPNTGYVHGGCSPVGMKKPYPTYIDETALLFDRFYVSAGKIGTQVGLNPEKLAAYIAAAFVPLTVE